MRKHSEEFKNKINLIGRELDSKITFGETELGNEQLNAVTPVLQSSLLKSVMKELDIDSNIDIPVGTIVNYKFGVLLDSGDYEYLDYGNYQIYSSEKQEDNNAYNIVAYDKMLNSMVEYTKLKKENVKFPISIRDYITYLCEDIGLEFKNKEDEFANYNRMIESDLYANLGYTYRDIFDELAQVTASNIIINENDEVEIKYITDTNDEINEEYLKDINVTFGEKYGPINSIVLSRSAGADNIYLQDEQSVADNGLCELKISDNQIMNFNDRSDYLPDILNKLNGLEYYINDFSSTGICYYEIADGYNISIGESTYPCVIFNDEINITQGLEETIYTELPEQAETDYTKADKTDRKINQTYIIVDKQNQTIESVVSQTDTFNERITKTEQDVESIRNLVDSAYDYVREKSGNNKLTIDEAQEGNLLELHITGEVELLYPQDDLYPEDILYPLDSYLIVENDKGEKRKFHLPNNNNYLYLYTFEDISDEFIIENIYNENSKEYERKAKIIRRVKVETDGTRSRLIDPITEDYGIVNITLFKGKNTIYLESFESLDYSVKYAVINELFDEYATKVELHTEISQTEQQIQSVASAKLDNTTFESYRTQTAQLIEDKVSNSDFTSYRTQTANEISSKVAKGDVVSEVNQSADLVSIKANRFELQSTNTQITKEGSFTTKNGTFTNCTIDGGSLKLSNGATVVGDNGLVTNLTYYGKGSSTSLGDFAILGYGTAIVNDTYTGKDDTDKDVLWFTISLPPNFTIKSAKIYLFMIPVMWQYISDKTHSQEKNNGYCRKLKLYKVNNISMTSNIEGLEVTFLNKNGTEVKNALGTNGVDGNQNTLKSYVSNDITSSISTTNINQFFIRTSETVPADRTERILRSGAAMGYVEIIGYMQF